MQTDKRIHLRPRARKTGGAKEGKAPFRPFEAALAVFGVVAFALVGPLRDALASVPEVLLAATAVLFLVPGALVARWFFGSYFSGAALLPAAVVFSAGGFALLGVPALVLQTGLGAYLWASGAVVAAAVLLAALSAALSASGSASGAFFGAAGGPAGRGGAERFGRGGFMWVPFVVPVGVLVYAARVNAPSFGGDVWIYLSWVREFLGGGALASEEPYFGDSVGVSRARTNGWLVAQAAFSRVSGVDPVDLTLAWIEPALAAVTLLAVYALARVLLENEKAALLCGCLYALFLLVNLDAGRLGYGGEFVSRITEDKMAARYVFFPMALGFAAAFLKGGGRAHLWAFAFVCCAVLAVHPVGLAIVGLSMAGFAVLHLAARPRDRAAWARVSALGASGLAAVAVPAASVLALTGESPTAALADSDINSGDPDVLRNMIFVQPGRERIFEFADGSYAMHASLVLEPAVAAALLVGLPFLLWRVRDSVAARLLFGMLYLTTVAVYVPAISTFLGDHVILPGQLWRLAWPIQLSAILTLGWVLWEIADRAGTRLGNLGPGWARPVARSAPLLLAVALTVLAAPRAVHGVDLVRHAAGYAGWVGLYPADPIYPWFRDEFSSPVVVLAADAQGVRVPAYSADANVVSRRGDLVLSVLPLLEARAPGRIEVPRGSRDVREFFSVPKLPRAVEILRRNDVDYVLVRSNSPLRVALDEVQKGFTPLEEPSERYKVYSVDTPQLESLVGHGGGPRGRASPQPGSADATLKPS